MRYDKKFELAETEVYDHQLKHLNTFATTDKTRKYGGVINLFGQMFMLYSRFYENKEKKCYEDVSLYAIGIRSDSFLLTKDSIALIEPFDMKSNFYRGNFSLSPDHSKLLVYDFEEDGDIDEVRGLTNEITLRVFDKDFKLLWKRKINLAPNPSGKRVMAIKKLRVNNAGEVAIMTDFFRNHRSYSIKEVTADPTLFFVGADPKNFTRFTPNLGDLFFNEIDFTFDHEGNLVWFGFYSNYKYYQQAGYFYIKINADRTRVLQKKIEPFNEDLLKALLHRKKLPRKPELRNFNLINFRLTANGDLVISAEYQPYGINYTKSHDILVMRLAPSGELHWAKHIYKFNNYPESLAPFLSHYMYVKGDDVYLLFNQGIYNDGKAIALKLDAAGTILKKEIFSYLSKEEVICPSLSYALPNGKVFLSLQSRFFKFYRFGLLDLEKLFE